MSLLFDTHALIWFFTDLDRLPKKVINLAENPSNNCLVSIASLWEIAIKHSINRLELEISLEDFYNEIKCPVIKIQPINPNHLLQIERLPNYHRDPFDRLIIAQAMAEEYTIVTKDQAFISYPANILWE